MADIPFTDDQLAELLAELGIEWQIGEPEPDPAAVVAAIGRAATVADLGRPATAADFVTADVHEILTSAFDALEREYPP